MTVFQRLLAMCFPVLFWQDPAYVVEVKKMQFKGLRLKSQQFWRDLNEGLFDSAPGTPSPSCACGLDSIPLHRSVGKGSAHCPPWEGYFTYVESFTKPFQTNLSPFTCFIYLAHIQEAVLFLWTELPSDTQIPKNRVCEFSFYDLSRMFSAYSLSQKHLFFRNFVFEV